ncbi:DUF2809 domain-containing protein [Pseudomonas fluorescens]|uniref:ribosomal maturation YjgA family protein n=1 Tax=Pseudomonas fluorescens TaxID=294 RepID=UPI001CD3CE8E
MVLLATLGAGWGWVRGFVGDLLAVMCVYCAFGAVVNARPPLLACAALLIGLSVEFAQYALSIHNWHISHPFLRIAFGSTPDWWDVVAYVIGVLLILVCPGRDGSDQSGGKNDHGHSGSGG